MDKVKGNNTFQDRLLQHEIERFLSFPDEKLILAARKHPTPLLFHLFQIFTIGFLAAVITSVVPYLFFKDILFSIGIYLTVALIGAGLIIKELINWYFHLYIITTKRIVEVEYSPLFSELTNSVLLDQLRCTEIDASMHGFVSEFLDLGDVTITFDRPTHHTEFTLQGIRSPRKIANYLSAQLHNTSPIESQHVWLRPQVQNVQSYGALRN